MEVVCGAVLLLPMLVFGQQLSTLVSDGVCQDLHVYLLLNTSEGAKLTHQSSRSEDPQTTIFVGEYIPPECSANFQRCNITVTTGNQRTVALISLIRGVGLILYNHMSSALQYLNHHVLDIPESLQCRMTAMHPLQAEGYILGLCLNLSQPEDDNIEHLLIYVNFTDIRSSVFYRDDGRYSAEHLFEPSMFSEFVFAPDARCIVDDSYHIYSVDDGYVLDFRKESSSDGFTYHEYCINHHGCSHAERLVLVSRNTLAMYCPSGTTILYDVCSTPTITDPQSCPPRELTLKELKVFNASVSGTPHFCSKEVYVLHKDNTLIVVHNDMTNWTIPLLTPPTDRIIYASCSQVGNETFFLSYWESGQMYLTHVTENVTNLIGRNTLVSNVLPKIFQQRYAVVNNRSETLVFNLSCTGPQIQISHPYHLATVTVAETTHMCECTQKIAVNGTTEPPAVTTDETTEPPAVTTDETTEPPAVTIDETTEPPAVTTDETTEPPTENSRSTDTTFSMTVNISTMSIIRSDEILAATVSPSVVVFAVLLSVPVIGVIICSVYYCRRNSRPRRLHQRIPPDVSTQGDMEMSERLRTHSAPPSPCHTSARHSESNRRISFTFGQDPPATQLSLFSHPTQLPMFSHPPGTANVPELAECTETDSVPEEERYSNTRSCRQRSEASLGIPSTSQDTDLQSTPESDQLFSAEQCVDIDFPVNSRCVPNGAPTQRTASLRTASASQDSDLQSASENGQLQCIGSDFTVTLDPVPVSTLFQPGGPRKDGVATGNELLLVSESVHVEDIRRQYRENWNEQEYKNNNLHSDFSQN